MAGIETAASGGFRLVELLQRLTDAGLRFVVIGGVAAQLRGSPIVTMDLDVCYARDREDLERLAAVLRDLHATLRGVAEPVPFRLDAETMRKGDAFTFTTDLGPLDVIALPAGSGGYEELDRNADDYDIGPVTVRVAAIDDLMRMKRAAGRPKDLYGLEHLAALRDELDGRSER